MKIILVGPDGAGKTSIAKEIAKQSGYEYIKPVKEDNDKVQRAIDMLNMEGDFIFDRFYYPDDLIYCPIKGISVIELNNKYRLYHHVADKLLDTEVFYVYVTASPETLSKRINERGDNYIVSEELPSIIGNYDSFFSTIAVPYVKINTDTITTGDAAVLVWYCIKSLKDYDFTLSVGGKRKCR